jgi:hypothetical protein
MARTVSPLVQLPPTSQAKGGEVSVIHVQVTARMFLESKISEQSATIVSGLRSAWPSQQQGMGRGAVERCKLHDTAASG